MLKSQTGLNLDNGHF